MGQAVRRFMPVDFEVDIILRFLEFEPEPNPIYDKRWNGSDNLTNKFPDLNDLPPELGLEVLSHLNATDLCLAACVWQELAADEILWQGLCRNQWGYVSIYEEKKKKSFSYRKLYLDLDEGTLTFNSDAYKGMEYFINRGLVADRPEEIASFFHHTNCLHPREMRKYLDSRRDVLEKLVELQDYGNLFLPRALRRFFQTIQAPNDRGNYLQTLLEKFSRQFCQCNPHLNLTPDVVYILCFSLILLSVDLTSPHVKNKMSKREFIRNVRNALQRFDDELYGHLYDDIYLDGHIAPNTED
ncbi:F-box only protein 8-like [Ischnura elegans]|uniref:F-box only protein 8-like n=1 Tax=Ischnura elegans TaxID=197161 RepID=UPI001ED8B238|nr:F-box only protein 8-like [Ischnura elegans]XP_046394936.1 F-box only protein 8-like [Ischnura elegans]